MGFNPSGLMIYFNLNPFAMMVAKYSNKGSNWQIKCSFTVFKRSKFSRSFRFDYDIFGMIVSFLILEKSGDRYHEKERE